MACTNSDFSLVQLEDSIITISLAPPVAIGGWNLQFKAQHRYGGLSGYIIKSSASGYGGGASGITVTNSGNGTVQVAINAGDTAGLLVGNHSYNLERLDSGNRTVLVNGFLSVLPRIGTT